MARTRKALRFSSIEEETFPLYLAEVEREAARAARTYGMLVVPGLELTFNDPEPVMAAHAVAVGLREFVSVDDGIAEAMKTAAQAGAAIIAAHPNSDDRRLCADRRSATRTPVARTLKSRSRLTKRFSRDAGLRALAHRFELFNRTQLFGWVADAALPAVASGDFHTPQHLLGWKTLLPSLHDESAVVEYLRSPRPVYLVRLDDELVARRRLTRR